MVEETSAQRGDRSARKHRAILQAAEEVFLRSGYLGTNMDEIATLSGVSKQTIYVHFGSKEALFVEIVTAMTGTASDIVHEAVPTFADDGDLARYLEEYALRQLTVVLTPRLMQLRRLVIGEVSRFPELAKVLFDRGPQHAITKIARVLKQLAARGQLTITDPLVAASHLNWLIMGEPVNRAMLLGDEALPTDADCQQYARDGVRVFLAAYGKGMR